MAVPKRKTSKSKRNMRRGHHSLKAVNVVVDKETGEFRLPHQMCSVGNSYKNRQVIVESEDDSEE